METRLGVPFSWDRMETCLSSSKTTKFFFLSHGIFYPLECHWCHEFRSGQFAFEPQRGDSATIGPGQKCIRGHARRPESAFGGFMRCPELWLRSTGFMRPLAPPSPPAQTGGCPRGWDSWAGCPGGGRSGVINSHMSAAGNRERQGRIVF